MFSGVRSPTRIGRMRSYAWMYGIIRLPSMGSPIGMFVVAHTNKPWIAAAVQLGALP